MAFCTKCGTAIPDSASLCGLCDAVTTGQPPPPLYGSPQPQPAPAAVPGAATAPAPLYFLSSFATGLTSGPFSEDAINTLIMQQRITMNDAVAFPGSPVWVPIMQSRFGPVVTQQINLNRIAASTCPRCSAGMAVVIKRSGLGLGLFIAGLVLTPAFGIGVPLIIVGVILRWGNEGTAAYYCPRCNFST